MPARFDPAATWRDLSPADRERLGLAAIILGYADTADEQIGMPDGFSAAGLAANGVIREIVADALPDGAPALLPDLAAIGVRACRDCGCTDDYGCGEGCWWVEADLCSACAEKPAKHPELQPEAPPHELEVLP